ncbi:MAG: hypothetical protein VKP62_14310 [Candidatus Sericytochromatia bacterium]|nr:hypothetical protein [Candidatus Sericytochromatia bacterium]
MRHSVYSIFFERADALEQDRRWDEALNWLYQAHRWVSNDPQYWLRLGVLSFRLTDRPWLEGRQLSGSHLADMGALNAEVYLERAERLDPSLPEPAFWRAWVRHRLLGEREAACRQWLELAERHPHWPYAPAALARLELVEAERGYAQRAREHLRQAIRRLPESPRLHYDLGAALVACEEIEPAREAFRQALSCPPMAWPQATSARLLAEEFHGTREALQDLIARYYAPMLERD